MDEFANAVFANGCAYAAILATAAAAAWVAKLLCEE